MKESYQQFIESQENLTPQWADWMLSEIGAVPDEFREEIYAGWVTLFNSVRFPLTERQRLLGEVMAQRLLFYGLADNESDAVFVRSFTSLFLTLLLKEHRKQPWMTETEVTAVIQQGIDYFQQETDNRGLVPDKGWAHAFAHGGDLLAASCLARELTDGEVSGMLAGITRAMVEIEDFLYGEEDRMLKAVMALLTTGRLSDEEVARWFAALGQAVGDDWNLCYTKFCMTAYFEISGRKLTSPMTQRKVTELLDTFYEKHGVL